MPITRRLPGPISPALGGPGVDLEQVTSEASLSVLAAMSAGKANSRGCFAFEQRARASKRSKRGTRTEDHRRRGHADRARV